VLFASLLLLGSESTHADDLKAVEQYWLNKHPALPPVQSLEKRTLPVEPLPGWAVLVNITEHRLYYFRENLMLHSQVAIVSVDNSGQVVHVKDERTFSDLMAAENIRVETAKNAVDVAQTYLHFRHLTTAKIYSSYKGHRAINSVDEIPFPDGEASLKTKLEIKQEIANFAPIVEKIGEGYVYSLFYWSPFNGDLAKVRVTVTQAGVVSYERTVLAEEVGEYGEY